jgi:hypothetical protein
MWRDRNVGPVGTIWQGLGPVGVRFLFLCSCFILFSCPFLSSCCPIIFVLLKKRKAKKKKESGQKSFQLPTNVYTFCALSSP